MTDLPYGRGGSPLQNLIQRGIYNTKITAFRITGELDAGAIYLQREFDISEGSAEEILQRAYNVIDSMIEEIIDNEIVPIEQIGRVTYWPRRKPSYSNMDSVIYNNIYDHIRMLDGDGYPKAYLDRPMVFLEFYDVKKKKNKLKAKVKIYEKDISSGSTLR